MNVSVTTKREAAVAEGDRLLGSHSPWPNHNAAPGTRMSTWLRANLRICARPASNQKNWWDMSLFLPFLSLLSLILMVFLLSFSFLFNPSNSLSMGPTASPSDMLTSAGFTQPSCSGSFFTKLVLPRCWGIHNATLAGIIQAGVFSNMNVLDRPVDGKTQRGSKEWTPPPPTKLRKQVRCRST